MLSRSPVQPESIRPHGKCSSIVVASMSTIYACSVCTGKLEAMLSDRPCLFREVLLSGEFPIFIMNCFNKICMPTGTPPDRHRRSTSIRYRLRHRLFLPQASSRYSYAVFHSRGCRCLLFIVNQNTGTSLFEFFCQFAVSYRGFVRTSFARRAGLFTTNQEI